MELAQIKLLLIPTFKLIVDEIENEAMLNKKQNKKFVIGRSNQIILSKLRLILGNPIDNPIMKYAEAEDYYFHCDNALENMQKKYMDILDLQNFITESTMTPFIYDKFTILKILQITLHTYNEFLDDIENNINARNEDVGNLFLDIEAMLINDRNASAENGLKNAGAIENNNKNKRKYGGYGVTNELPKTETQGNNILVVTPEQAEQKLRAFGFSNLLDQKTKKK